MASSAGARVALVTGASAGIGKAIARRLLADGWTVYGAARRVERMEDLRAEGARILHLDVADEASRVAAVDRLLNAEGRIDALVNDAGYGVYGALEDVPAEEARRQFEVNVFGLMRLTQLVLPTMRAARAGTIVNVSSVGGRLWLPMAGWYYASKHALEALSDVLRVEVRPFGVRVVVVQPGAIRTEFQQTSSRHLERSAKGSPYLDPFAEVIRALQTHEKPAAPEVVADAVSRALRARSPRRRYVAPWGATGLLVLRWLLPEWAWERLAGAGLRALERRGGRGRP